MDHLLSLEGNLFPSPFFFLFSKQSSEFSVKTLNKNSALIYTVLNNDSLLKVTRDFGIRNEVDWISAIVLKRKTLNLFHEFSATIELSNIPPNKPRHYRKRSSRRIAVLVVAVIIVTAVGFVLHFWT